MERKLAARYETEIFVNDRFGISIRQTGIPGEEPQTVSFDRGDAPLIIQMIKDACAESEAIEEEEATNS